MSISCRLRGVLKTASLTISPATFSQHSDLLEKIFHRNLRDSKTSNLKKLNFQTQRIKDSNIKSLR